MITMTLAEAAALLEITTMLPTTSFTGLSIDTRTLQPGNLFIAIPGNQVDGHDFVEIAQSKGAAAALVTHQVNSSLPQLCVTDIVIALGKLAAAWRKKFTLPLLSVTGSNGKTTTKNLMAAILVAAANGHSEQVLATKGTLNNHLGLPLTLAQLNQQHRFAAIEMGMNHFNEIDYLTRLAQPTVAIITNAGPCHLEGVGDLAGVARAKAEIFAGLSKEGIAILNRDDAFYDYWLKQAGSHRSISFGLNNNADVYASNIQTTQTEQFTLHANHHSVSIQLPLIGKHNIQNALAAAAAAIAIGIDLTTIKKGLEQAAPAQGRLQVHTLNNGTTIIDDTYNANPLSLQAAVNTLSTFNGKKIVVLGDMKELGPEAKTIHQTAGANIRDAGIDHLFTFGELSANSSECFGDGAQHFTEQASLVQALQPYLAEQATILVKGSRSMSMEKIVAKLMR